MWAERAIGQIKKWHRIIHDMSYLAYYTLRWIQTLLFGSIHKRMLSSSCSNAVWSFTNRMKNSHDITFALSLRNPRRITRMRLLSLLHRQHGQTLKQEVIDVIEIIARHLPLIDL